MKLLPIIIGVSVFIFTYGLLNYYIGIRGWQMLNFINPSLNIKLYWLIFWFVALSYILARVCVGFLPKYVDDALTYLGSYWMAIMVYSFFVVFAIDIMRFLNKYIHFIPSTLLINPTFILTIGISAFVLIFGIVAFGTYNAKSPHIKHYDITINKNRGQLKDLHIAMVSDVHLGKMINNVYLEKMVSMINVLNPDIILICGDVIDESVETFMERDMSSSLSKLKSKYGTYGALGNHEYYAGHTDQIIQYLNSAGIKILRDEYIQIDNSFYLAGREHNAVSRITGTSRKNLSSILNGIDKLPIILMDHEPQAVKEAEDNNIDLMLSGHTHHGQLFPANLVTSSIFEIDWGHLKKGDFNIIVSSGFGTWGPPIRIGNRPEIVDIIVHFK